MRRMTAVPDVAMTLALLGTRLSRVGMRLSAAWSNLLPSNDDKCLWKESDDSIRGYCLSSTEIVYNELETVKSALVPAALLVSWFQPDNCFSQSCLCLHPCYSVVHVCNSMKHINGESVPLEESEQLLVKGVHLSRRVQWWGSVFLHINQPSALLEASSSVPPHQGLQLNLGEWCCWVCGFIPGQSVFISVWKEHMLSSSSVTTSSVIRVS